MKKNEELFYLIKSLSKSEKRYFKLSIHNKEDSEYLLLFNAIDTQETYDEAKIKTLFKDKLFITQLTTIKNYLKQRILLSLRNYHSKITIQAELIDIIRNVEVLFHKGLYNICESELKRAEKKAKHFQQNLLLFTIHDWTRKIHAIRFPEDFKTLKINIQNQKKILTETIEYVDLLLANIEPNQFSISNKKELSLQNKTLSTLHQYRKLLTSNNSPKAKETLEKILKEWEQHPELLKEYFPTYFSVSNNYLSFLVYKKLYKEAFVRILLLKQKASVIQPVSAALIKETLRLYNTELEIHRSLKDLHNTQNIIEEIQNFITKHSTLVPQNYELSFRFQFATINFLQNNYKETLYWVNHILNNPNKKNRKDLIIYTHWLNLLTHYELANDFTLKHLINNTKKHIKKHKNIESYEKVLLKFLAKTVNYIGIEKRKAFNFLEQELTEHPIPKKVLGYIDLNRWINNNCNN